MRQNSFHFFLALGLFIGSTFYAASASAHLDEQDRKDLRAHWQNTAVFTDQFNKMNPEGSIHVRVQDHTRWQTEVGYGRTVRSFKSGDRFRDSWLQTHLGFRFSPEWSSVLHYQTVFDANFYAKNSINLGPKYTFSDRTVIQFQHGILKYKTALHGTTFKLSAMRPFDELSEGMRFGLAWQTTLVGSNFYGGKALNEGHGSVGYAFNSNIDASATLMFGRGQENEFLRNGFAASDLRLNWALSPTVRVHAGTAMYRSETRDEERYSAGLDLYY